MKKRSREINVFSISALDLFASALGAFILMSLIFMVFFSMTSRESGDAQDVNELAEALARCEARMEGSVDASALDQCRAEVAVAEAAEAALGDELARVRIPHLDIVICLDITGSMRSQIEDLKQEITDLARVLDGLAPSAGIGIVAYGDVVYRRPIHRHPIVPTGSLGSLRSFVAALEPEMGNDEGVDHGLPEAVGLALAEAVGANWRAQSERRYIIVITDAPAYDHRLAYSYGLAREFAAAGDQYVSGVMVRNNNAESFLRELARSGQGQFVNDVGGQSMIASVLLAIIDV